MIDREGQEAKEMLSAGLKFKNSECYFILTFKMG